MNINNYNDNIIKDYPLNGTPQTIGMNYFICGCCLSKGKSLVKNGLLNIQPKLKKEKRK